MRNLSLWNNNDWGLFRDFDRLHENMNRLFEDFWRTHRQPSVESYIPACDIEETAGHYVMSFDLPGMSKDDIEVQVEGNQLRISGERKREERKESAEVQRVERAYGRFYRSFSLPSGVEVDKIEANFENGVLTLVLPKAESAKTRQIKVTEGRGNILDRVFRRNPELKAASDKK